MKEKILRKLLLGFIQIHILHHAKKEPIYGTWMMDELRHHGYNISSGTLYPTFHTMTKNGLLTQTEKLVEGRIRKYYSITPLGEEVLQELLEKSQELYHEVKE